MARGSLPMRDGGRPLRRVRQSAHLAHTRTDLGETRVLPRQVPAPSGVDRRLCRFEHLAGPGPEWGFIPRPMRGVERGQLHEEPLESGALRENEITFGRPCSAMLKGSPLSKTPSSRAAA